MVLCARFVCGGSRFARLLTTKSRGKWKSVGRRPALSKTPRIPRMALWACSFVFRERLWNFVQGRREEKVRMTKVRSGALAWRLAAVLRVLVDMAIERPAGQSTSGRGVYLEREGGRRSLGSFGRGVLISASICRRAARPAANALGPFVRPLNLRAARGAHLHALAHTRPWANTRLPLAAVHHGLLLPASLMLGRPAGLIAALFSGRPCPAPCARAW